jgi:hypothetical protein
MHRPAPVRAASLFAFLILLSPVVVTWPVHGTAAFAQGAASDEKDAYQSAKELGTKEAWDAFLASYPKGFYADMARAYLKKLETQPEAAAPVAPAAAPLAPSSARAGERPCADRNALRSEHSREPTKITFVNKSGMYRAFQWIDFDGKLKDYGGINPGEQITFDTFRTHPWRVATGPGDCLQIFMPAAEPATVELQRLPADDAPARDDAEAEPPRREKQAEKTKKKTLVCGKNYKLKNGECVLLQNCGKNAYRTAEGDCTCKKGYKMKNGTCQWPTDKQGFEIAPWKKSGCKTWQAQCAQGNNNACGQYEANCQVN